MRRLGPDTATRTSQDQIYAIHTARAQSRVFVQTDRWSDSNRWRVRVRAEYSRFPLPFYGVGSDAEEEDEEWYTPSGWNILALTQRKVALATFAGAAARVSHTRIAWEETSGIQASDRVYGADGGTVAQIQAFLARDSRDHAIAPRRGMFLQVTSAVSNRAWGSDFDFSRHALDSRGYRTLGTAHVLAAQVLTEVTAGRVPFDQLVQIGSDSATRGYTRGRYRDNNGISAQAEYRSPYRNRIGFVTFVGAGVLAPTMGQLAQATVLPSYGIGLRVLLIPRERAALRADYGRGNGSSGFYLSFGEAF